jgi:hypothetical protein
MKASLTPRTYLSVLIATLSLLLLVACGGDDETTSGQTPSTAMTITPIATVLITDAKEQYCEARDGFKASLEQVKTLTAKPSVDQIKVVGGDIKAKWADLKASARNVAGLQLQDLDKAVNNLQSSIDSLNQNTSLAGALASVALPAAEVVREAQKVDLDKPCQA